MPECIEVERLRKQLSPFWVGRTLTNVRAPIDSPNPKKYVQGSWSEFRQSTKNFKIIDLKRYGKHLWVALEKGAWHIHLGSTGWFWPVSTDPKEESNFLHAPGKARLHLIFDDGQQWNYHDPRTWGVWYLREGSNLLEDPYFKDYGPDWLMSPGHAVEVMMKCTSGRTVKEVLCDQKLTAGLGNYLSVEACAIAGIHPHHPFNLLSLDRRQILMAAIHTILELSGKTSDHTHWRVFNKAGAPCQTCGAPIQYVKDKGGSRGSYFCANCQPLRK